MKSIPSMRGRATVLVLAFAIAAAYVAFLSRPKARLSVELGKIQVRTGVTLTATRPIAAIHIAEMGNLEKPWRELGLPEAASALSSVLLSNDGERIAFARSGTDSVGTVRMDGSDLHEFTEIEDFSLADNGCWSPDNSKLVLKGYKGKSMDYRLYVLDWLSGNIQEVADDRGHVSPQCWSPDSRLFVFYEADSVIGDAWPGMIRMYDVATSQSHDLVRLGGEAPLLRYEPTWSPDGKWIAVLERDSYHAVSPSGKDRKVLFARKGAASPLLWSPDSRYAAYCYDASFMRLDGGDWRLRVRRLADGEDVSFGECGNYEGLHWIKLSSAKPR